MLSICIATFKRAAYISATLETIVNGLPPGVEVVIVDGASPDDTPQVVAEFVRRSESVRYFRETQNSGVDRDFDKSVCVARGDFCWLMSDDDVLAPGAIDRVLALLEPSLDLLVVNAQIRSVDLATELSPRILDFSEDRFYDSDSRNRFLAEVGNYLSFIGGVVIRRELWLHRNREPYFGTAFIHVGVIFQAPLSRVRVIADPLVSIRYGNAMWTSRGFEIWMFRWPSLVWSFNQFEDAAKARVVPREPWTHWRRLIHYRALGAYSYVDYCKYFKDTERGGLLQLILSLVPAVIANVATAVVWLFKDPKPLAGIYDLVRSPNSSFVTRLVARRLKVPTT